MGGRRGLVLEINKGKAILLCPGGDFRSAAMPRGTHWVVGQEVSLEVLASPAPVRRGWLGVRPAAMALALALALVAVGMPVAGYVYSRPLPAVAYLSVDINPSFEVGVDVRGRTTSVTALNEDAAKLLENRTFAGPADKVVAQLVSLSVRAGYLGSPDALVLITSALAESGADQRGKSAAAVDKVLAQAKSSVQSALAKDNKTNQVQDLKLDSETRENARAEGMSPGKFAILLAAQTDNLAVTADDLKSGSVAQVIKAAGGKVGEVIGHAAQVKDFRPLTREYMLKAKEKGDKGQDKDKDKDKDEDRDKDKDKDKGSRTPPANPDSDKEKGLNPGGEAPAPAPVPASGPVPAPALAPAPRATSVAVVDGSPGVAPKESPGTSGPPPGIPRGPTGNGEVTRDTDRGQGDSRAGAAGYSAVVAEDKNLEKGPWEKAKDDWITVDRQGKEPEKKKEEQPKGDKEPPGQSGSPKDQPGTGDGAGKRGR